MDPKELAALVQSAVDELHKAVERQDGEIKKLGEPTAETKAIIDRCNERIDELEVKLQRQTIPTPGSLSSPWVVGTKHLSEEVVKQEVVIGIWVTTHSDNPRAGEASIGVLLGGRANPDLTSEELEYLEHCLDYARQKLPQKLMKHLD